MKIHSETRSAHFFDTQSTPLSVADTRTEKVVIGTLMDIDALSYVSPFRWIPHLSGCGSDNIEAEPIDVAAPQTGCTTDVECREPRICEGGQCVYPINVASEDPADADSSSIQNPCEEIDCEGHGQCFSSIEGAAQCFCDNGYKTSEENPLACVEEARSRCLDERTASMLMPDGEYYTVECGPGSHCEEGACRTSPGQEDPNCLTTVKSSSCQVTAVWDIEGSSASGVTSHGVQEARNSVGSWSSPTGGWTAYDREYNCGYGEKCGNDFGFELGFLSHCCSPADAYDCWAAATLNLLPPPRANYYRLDAKTVPDPERGLHFELLFGDDQPRQIDIPPDGIQQCGFEQLGIFTTAGIDTDHVSINFIYRSASEPPLSSGGTLNKLRLWSCTCD